MARFKNEKEFLEAYNPDKQYIYCRYKEKCLIGNAPTIDNVRDMYGEKVAESWLCIQIHDVCEFSNNEKKMSIEQIDALAKTIAVAYGDMKITQLMYFFFLFKAGKFGKFYASIDGLVISSELCRYKDEIRSQIKYLTEEYVLKKKKEKAEKSQKEMVNFYKRLDAMGITREQYVRNRRLFSMGLSDEEIKKRIK